MKIEDLKRYVELKEQIRTLETELEPINKAIKAEIKEAGTYLFDDYSVELTASVRESFDLKKACGEVTTEIWNAVIEPYKKVSSFVTLKVNRIRKAS